MVYLFGLYELDTHLRELRRAGQPFFLQPRVFQVLAYLVQHRDRVVTRQELIQKFWSAEFVDRTVVARSIMAARRAIADDGDSSQYIQTVRGHGYHFVAAVTEREEFEDAMHAPIPEATLVASPPAPASSDMREKRVGGALTGERKLVTALCGVLALAVAPTRSKPSIPLYFLIPALF